MPFDREAAVRLSQLRIHERKKARRGAAAVELAVLLPVLIFWSMATVDYARVAAAQLALQNCSQRCSL